MRRTIAVAVATLALVALAGTVPASAAEPVSAEIFWLPDPTNVVHKAGARLERTDDGIRYAFHTRGLTAGDAVTIWVVVFNNPDACTTNTEGPAFCGAGDLGNPDVAAGLLQGDGKVVHGKGVQSFHGTTLAGDTSVCQPNLPCNGGLTNVDGAEIHLVSRTHGPAVEGYVDAQISTFNGGCNEGEPNVGLCKNLQASLLV